MKLNKVKEIGFYRAIEDEKPDYIFEVIENTNEEWLKDEPNAKLLIDEWSYEYTDTDDRRHYETFGNLVQVQYADEIDVVKMNEKFIVSGNAGTHLTENIPTYKEKYLSLKAENEKLKTKIFDEGLRRKTCRYYKQVCSENTQLIAYRNALEEIKAIAELEVIIFDNKPLFPTNIQRIIDKIEEVLKDE